MKNEGDLIFSIAMCQNVNIYLLVSELCPRLSDLISDDKLRLMQSRDFSRFNAPVTV